LKEIVKTKERGGMEEGGVNKEKGHIEEIVLRNKLLIL